MYLWMQFALRLLPKVHDLSLHLCWKKTFLLSLKSSLHQSKSPARAQLLTPDWGDCYKICSLTEGSVRDLCALLDPVSAGQPHPELCCSEAPAQSLLCPCCCVPALLHVLVWILTHEGTCWLDPDLPHHHNLIWWSEPVVELLCCPQACLIRCCGRWPCRKSSLLFWLPCQAQLPVFEGAASPHCSLRGRGSNLQKKRVTEKNFWVGNNWKINTRSLLFHAPSLPKPTLFFLLNSSFDGIWNIFMHVLFIIYFYSWNIIFFLWWNWIVGLVGYSYFLNLQAFCRVFSYGIVQGCE